jgi:hypothetical protein
MSCRILISFVWMLFPVFYLATAADNFTPSPNPPGGLSAANVPQFVNVGFDDNSFSDGINWILDTLLKNKTNSAGTGNSAPLYTRFFTC